jgi:hypothetical protein
MADVTKYTQCDKECYLRAKMQIGPRGDQERDSPHQVGERVMRIQAPILLGGP